MKDAGFLLGKTGIGRNVLTSMPSLAISRDELARAVVALAAILHATKDSTTSKEERN